MIHIFGNWKMYLDVQESIELANKLLKTEFEKDKISLAVFPNTLAVAKVMDIFQNGPIDVGAQSVNWAPKGAYSGAVSALLFKEIGCAYALVGHSERRHIFGETNETVRKKLEACIDVGLTPVLCVGETAKDREEGKTEYRIKKQLMKALQDLPIQENHFFIAYEPVWAITGSGAGVPCDPVQAGQMHALIKNELKEYTDTRIPLIYGGSAKAENVLSYLAIDLVDGVLPGHASTKIDSFVSLIRKAETV